VPPSDQISSASTQRILCQPLWIGNRRRCSASPGEFELLLRNWLRISQLIVIELQAESLLRTAVHLPIISSLRSSNNSSAKSNLNTAQRSHPETARFPETKFQIRSTRHARLFAIRLTFGILSSTRTSRGALRKARLRCWRSLRLSTGTSDPLERPKRHDDTGRFVGILILSYGAVAQRVLAFHISRVRSHKNITVVDLFANSTKIFLAALQAKS